MLFRSVYIALSMITLVVAGAPATVSAMQEEMKTEPSETKGLTAQDAKDYANHIGQRVLDILADKTQDNAQKLQTLEQMFVKVVDVDWVGRFVLGRHWRSATEEQRQHYLDAYRDFLISHYTSRFAEYSGETFEIPIAREERPGEFFVRMEVQRANGEQPIIVDYRVRAKGQDFSVFDIIVEGVSLIATQRSEFGAFIGREGLDALTKRLASKTASLRQEVRQKMDTAAAS